MDHNTISLHLTSPMIHVCCKKWLHVSCMLIQLTFHWFSNLHLGPISIEMHPHSIIFFSYVAQCFTKLVYSVSWHLRYEFTEALVAYNQPSHHKTSHVHGLTSLTPPSKYCGPMHYFAGWDWLDGWIHLLVSSNDPSQWTHRVAYSDKGHPLTLTTITSKDWVNNVHQLLVNNV